MDDATKDERCIDGLIATNSPLIESVVQYAIGDAGADTISATMGLGIAFVSRVLDRASVQERIRTGKLQWIENAFRGYV